MSRTDIVTMRKSPFLCMCMTVYERTMYVSVIHRPSVVLVRVVHVRAVQPVPTTVLLMLTDW